MSPRPRTKSDAEILAATARVVGRAGPHRLTLALVAREAGLAPATLVQRFGSKRALLLALARVGTSETRSEGGPVPWGKSPLRQLRSYLVRFAQLAASPLEMANHLAFLQIDLTDPAFHRITREHFRATEREVRALLDRAVKAGELIPTDTARLTRALVSVVNGSLLTWAIHREGTAEAWLKRDLATVLAPFERG